ncbi:hypothetical protein NFI96_011313 [Prochilodus magdalenae]|nr:hypothetical protein NFI96_011313 [Prochilodus magdalenae]
MYFRRRILLRSRSDWSSTSEHPTQTTTDQLRFTSFVSLRLPSKGSEKKQTGGSTEAPPCSDDLHFCFPVHRRSAVVQHPELREKGLPPNSLRGTALKAAKDENVSKPPYGKEGATRSHQTHFGRDISSQRSTEGIQRGVALRDRVQAAENCLQGRSPASDHLIELPVTESAARESGVNDCLGKNAEGVHRNLIPFGEDSGSKASTNRQPSACSPGVLKRTLSLPSFPATHHGCKVETEPHLIDPTTAMFTSTIVSVLAPHWSGRTRRGKRGGNEVEQDIHVSGPSAFSQRSHQRSFLLSHRKPAGEVLDEFNNKLREPVWSSRSAVEWQKKPHTDFTSTPNLTATFQTKRPSLLDTKQQTVDSKVELGIPAPGQVHRPPLSLHTSSYNRTSQSGDQEDPFSLPTSRPTTSSLLLYWRRLNSRKANGEPTEIEKQLAMSVGSLTLPSKTKLRASQPQSPLLSPDDPTKEIFALHKFPTSPEQLKSPVNSPVSPGGRRMETSGKSMFLSQREFDISGRTFSHSTKEGLRSSIPSRPSKSETVNGPQPHSKESLERKSSHVGNNESVDQSYTNLYNSNMNSLHRAADFPSKSPKDVTNNNVGGSVSHSYHNSNNIVKKHSQPLEPTPNLSSYKLSNGACDENSNKTNTSNSASTSNTSVTCSSQTSPRPLDVSPSAGLASMSLTRTGLSTQNSVVKSSSLSPENLSPSSTSSLSGRTFASSLAFSPRKEPSAVEGTSPSHVWLNHLNSRQSQSNRSPSDLTSPSSPSRHLRRVHTPSVYTYLRETSPSITTRTSSTYSSSSPQTPALNSDGDRGHKEDKNTRTSRFTFDLSRVESQDSALKQDSCTSSVPQSLPPDFGRRSGPRLSKSPYSTLISARPALNSTLQNLSSPPVSYRHSKSASFDSSPILTDPPNMEKDMSKDSLIQGTSREPGGSSNKYLIVDKGQTSYVSRDTSSRLQSSPDTRFTDCQTTKLIPKTTHPKQSGVVIKEIPQQGLYGMFSSQSDKGNTYAAQGLNYKEHASTLSTLGVSEAPIVQEQIITSQTHETLHGIQNVSSKKGLFSKSKKDNILTSASSSSSSKEDSTQPYVKKGDNTAPKSNRMDLVLNRLKSTFKRSEDDDFTARRKTKNVNQQSSELKASGSKKKEERCHQSQTSSSNSQNSTVRESSCSSRSSSGFTFKNKEHENHKRLEDENGNQFRPPRPQSPNRPKPHYINRYATMPQTRKPNPGPSLYPSEFALTDEQNDDVFYFPTKGKSSFGCKPDSVHQQDNALTSKRKHLMGAHLSMSCADLMYGLERGRSVSVSSVVSGRPSGPGRISTGSKQSSVGDLTSLDEFVTRSRHSSISSSDVSPGCGVRSPSSLAAPSTFKTCAGRSNERLWSPVKLEASIYSVDTEGDPTPPPSPTFSPNPRRMSQIPSSSSNGSRTSQDSLSPRGFMPSRNYKSTLSVFEESGSDTTTDDEYYLNSDYDDDEKETEL